jgi:phosphoglycerate kinase
MPIRFLESLPVEGKKVFLRVDFNVPLGPDGKILDDSRIQAALPTIRHLLERRASVIIASHLGRPKKREEDKSLVGVGERLSDLLGADVIFPEDCIGYGVKKLVHDLEVGKVMLLENLRFHPEEEQNDPLFSERLAELGEVYLTDAFGTLHRAHASTVGMVAAFKTRGAGLLVQKELHF